MTTYTPTKSATGRDWPAMLTADPTLWPQHGDWLAENEAEWRHQDCGLCPACGRECYYEEAEFRFKGGWECAYCDKLYSHCPKWFSLPYHQQPPYLVYLTGWLVGLLDERRHGLARCPSCQLLSHGSIGPHCGACRPTFATLFDRPCECAKNWLSWKAKIDCTCSGRQVIPGHLTELAQWMTECGDPRGEEVGALTVRNDQHLRGLGWNVVGKGGTLGQSQFTFPDACREAIRRVHAMLTVKAPPGESCGLGWLATGGPDTLS